MIKINPITNLLYRIVKGNENIVIFLLISLKKLEDLRLKRKKSYNINNLRCLWMLRILLNLSKVKTKSQQLQDNKFMRKEKVIERFVASYIVN